MSMRTPGAAASVHIGSQEMPGGLRRAVSAAPLANVSLPKTQSI